MYRCKLNILLGLSVLIGVNGTLYFCIPSTPDNLQENSSDADVMDLLKTNFKKIITGILSENDTIHIPHLNFDFAHPIMAAKGCFDDVDVSNYSDYDLKTMIYTHGWKVFELTFNNISVKGKYNMTGNIGDLFDVFGAGNFWFNLVTLTVSMPLRYNRTAHCFATDLNVSVDKLENYFDGLMNNEELEDLINRALTSVGPEAITELWSEFKEAVDVPLQKIIDDAINGTLGNDLENLQNSVLALE